MTTEKTTVQNETTEEMIQKRVGNTKDQLEKIKWIDKQTMKEQFGAVHLVILFVLAIFLFWDIIAFGISFIFN